MINCPDCQRSNKEGRRFCSDCGSSVTAATKKKISALLKVAEAQKFTLAARRLSDLV